MRVKLKWAMKLMEATLYVTINTREDTVKAILEAISKLREEYGIRIYLKIVDISLTHNIIIEKPLLEVNGRIIVIDETQKNIIEIVTDNIIVALLGSIFIDEKHATIPIGKDRPETIEGVIS
ncbi:MAG: hypothetical protein QXE99_06950 [Acidilobaceae archaeon]